jgi:hypothetical protein
VAGTLTLNLEVLGSNPGQDRNFLKKERTSENTDWSNSHAYTLDVIPILQ